MCPAPDLCGKTCDNLYFEPASMLMDLVGNLLVSISDGKTFVSRKLSPEFVKALTEPITVAWRIVSLLDMRNNLTSIVICIHFVLFSPSDFSIFFLFRLLKIVWSESFQFGLRTGLLAVTVLSVKTELPLLSSQNPPCVWQLDSWCSLKIAHGPVERLPDSFGKFWQGCLIFHNFNLAPFQKSHLHRSLGNPRVD